MQKNIWQDEHLKSYKNSFCDSEKSTILEFCSLSQSLKMFEEGYQDVFSAYDLLQINRYAVLKNLQADCKDLTLCSLRPDLAQQALEEYKMNGQAIYNITDLLSSSAQQQSQQKSRCYYIPDLSSFSEAQLNMIAENLGRAEVYIEFYRTLEEAGTLDKTYNKSPARVLEDFGFLDRRAHLIGCNFLDKDDARILANYNAEVIITPQADMLLGRGAINLKSLLGCGLDIKLGSGEHPNADMLDEGRLALGNTANLMLDPFALSRDEIQAMIVSDKDVDEMLTDVRLEKQREIVKNIFKEKKL